MRDQDVFAHISAAKNETLWYLANLGKSVQSVESRLAVLIKALDLNGTITPALFRKAGVQMRWDARKQGRKNKTLEVV